MCKSYLLLLLTAIAACRPEPVIPEPAPIPSFQGITFTDFNGAFLGDPDTTDWRLDDVWLPAEASLFPLISATGCSSSEGFMAYPAYPNPCGDVLGLGFVSSSNAILDLVLVDEKLVPLRRAEGYATVPGSNNLQLDLAGFPKDTLRLYYRIRTGSCVLRGHGDILRQ